MSEEWVHADVGPLTEALLLADPDDRQSLDDLAECLKALLPWPRPEQAGVGDPVIRECLDLLGAATQGDGHDVVARVSALLEPVIQAAAEPVPPADAPGQDATADRPEPHQGAAAPEERADTGHTDKDQAATAAASLADDPELVREFADHSCELLDEADALLLALEDDQDDAEAVNSVFRAFHTIKGMAGFLAFKEIEDAAHEAEGRLDAVRKDTAVLDRGLMDTLFAAVDVLRQLIAQVAEPSPAVSQLKNDADAVEDAGQELGPTPAQSSPPPDSPAPQANEAVETAKPSSAPATGARRVPDTLRRTVNVDEDRLDRLLEAIGELVIAEASVSQLVRSVDGASGPMAAQFSRLDKISRQLQEMATSMRMVSLRTTMRRMARLVRDLSHETGKNVKCVLEGEDIELDKHVVDAIADPLIHLVRNAVDHGIEAGGEQRVRAGKPSSGTVRLCARHTGGRIVIEVADDGGGIDADAVVRKAREMGILGPDETPPSEDVPQLIFAPGFSTAASVTGVSGRGVGMDVVKRVVDGLLGSIAVISSPGQGTTVRLTLPLTLAIIDGMVVRVGEQRYIIPSLSIVRSLRLEPGEVTGVLGTGEMLTTPQGLVPLVRLDRLFATAAVDCPDNGGNGDRRHDELVTIVSEADGSSLTGLVVSELLGQQQIVMKSLGTGLGEVPGVSGAAILPDGTVGLIIDVQQTVRLARGGKG